MRDTDNLPYEKIGNNEPICIADEVPFEIPDSWAWCRIGSLVQINPRNNIDDDIDAGFVPMTFIKDGFRSQHSFEIRKWKNIKSGFTHFANGDVVFAKITPCFQNRKSAIISKMPNNYGAGTTELHVLRDCTDNLYMPYLLLICKTNNFIKNGVKNLTGTAGQQRIGKDFVFNYLFPLPPLNEQKKICQKISEILPLLNEYETLELQNNSLNKAFAELLKKSILQAAVQGNLVLQDENDEPASLLLKRIKSEKEKLIKAGKIKKDKHESVIFRRDNSYYEKLNGIEHCIDNEIPFEIPESWCWVRLGTLFQHNTGKALNSSNTAGVKLTYITTSNLYWDKFELDKLKEMPFTESEIEKCTVIRGDLLVCEGGDIGRAAVWNYDFPTRIQNHIHRLRSYIDINNRFYYYVFFLYKNIGLIGGKGIGIKGLSSNAIHQILFPLPPLAEQNKIVTTIKKIFSYCEKL